MWTDAAIETLRQMALEGKSASCIAMALGAPSRNAVIGKANRIGVKLTGHIHSWRRERLGQARSGRGDPRSPAPTLLYGSESLFPLSRASESRHGPSPRPRSGRC
jgi:hypothetical protein